MEPVYRPDLPTFRREDVLWAVAYHRKVVRLRASKGLGYLSRLVAAPGTRIRASDLVEREPGRADGRVAERDRVSVTKGIKAAIGKIALHHPELARHLEQGVRTGAFCCYLPVLPFAADTRRSSDPNEPASEAEDDDRASESDRCNPTEHLFHRDSRLQDQPGNRQRK